MRIDWIGRLVGHPEFRAPPQHVMCTRPPPALVPIRQPCPPRPDFSSPKGWGAPCNFT
jgi:hypothetical protein